MPITQESEENVSKFVRVQARATERLPLADRGCKGVVDCTRHPNSRAIKL